MSQVRKFQDGGSSPKKTYGKFIIDGVEHEANEDFMKQFDSYLNGLEPKDRRFLGDVKTALSDGNTVEYNSDTNRIFGVDDWSNLNDKETKKFSKVRSNLKRAIDATFGGNAEEARKAILKLGKFKYVEPTPDDNRILISGGYRANNGVFDWNEKKFSTGIDNNSLLSELSNIKDYLNSETREDADKKYKWSNRFSKSDIDDIWNWYSNNRNYNWDNLVQFIKSNPLNENQNEFDILKKFGYNANYVDPSVKEKSKESIDQELSEQNAEIDKHFVTNNDGEKVASNNFFTDLGLRPGNYWFNDIFEEKYKNSPLAKALYKHLIINNKLYKETDPNLANILISNNFSKLNSEGNFSEANKIINYLWGNPAEWSSLNDTNWYSSFLSNPTMRFRDVTGQYGGINNGDQIVEYFVTDPKNANVFGLYPQEKFKYALLDQFGNLIEDNYTPNKEEGYVAKPHSLSLYKKINSPATVYNGKYRKDITDKNNAYSGYSLYINPTDSNDLILHWEGMNYDYKLPKEFIDVINSHSNFWETLLKDRNKQKNLISFLKNKYSKNDLINLGFDEYNAQKLMSERKNGPSKQISRVSFDALGGIINKLQAGGLIGTSGEITSAPTQVKVNTEYNNVVNPYKIGNPLSDMTTEDWLDAGSLMTDAAAIAMNLTGVGSIPAAITAQAGDVAALVSDSKRDGMDWGDWGRFGVSTALNAATLVPWAGSAAKASSFANKLRKSGKVVLKLLAAAGVGDAVYSSAKKIINGDRWTFRDLRAVTNGLAGATNIMKLGLVEPKMKNNQTVELSTKSGKKFSLPKEEYDQKIEGLNRSEWKNKKAEILSKGLKETISKDDVSKNIPLFRPNPKINNEFSLDVDYSKKSPFSQFLHGARPGQVYGPTVVKTEEVIPDTPDVPTHTVTKESPIKLNAYQEWLKSNKNYMRTVFRPEYFHKKDETYKYPKDYVPANEPEYKNGGVLKMQSGSKLFQKNSNGILGLYSSINDTEPLWTFDAKSGNYVNKNGDILTSGELGTFDPATNSFQNTIEPSTIVAERPQISTIAKQTRIPSIPSINSSILQNNSKYAQSSKISQNISVPKIKITPIEHEEENKNYFGDILGDKIKLNVDPDSLLGLTSLVESLAYNKKAHDLTEKGIKAGLGALEQMPTEIYDRYSDYGLNGAYTQKANAERNIKGTSSDYLINYAIEQSAKNNALNTELEGRLKSAELFGNHLAENNNLRRDYANKRTMVANDNNKSLANLAMAKYQNDAERYVSDHQSIQNMIMEQRNKLYKNQQKVDALNYNVYANNMQKSLDSNLQESFPKEYATYSALSNEDKSLYGTFSNYMYKTNPEAYSSWNQSEGVTKLYNDYYTTQIPWYLRGQIKEFAKGGNMRSTSDEIWIQNNKNASDAAKKLSDNVIKLFLIATR